MADDYVPYVPIPYTPLPYVSSREYSNRPYTQSLMELVGRAGQREAEATRRRSELLASRTGALGQIASSTLGSLFAGRDEAAKLAEERRRYGLQEARLTAQQKQQDLDREEARAYRQYQGIDIGANEPMTPEQVALYQQFAPGTTRPLMRDVDTFVSLPAPSAPSSEQMLSQNLQRGLSEEPRTPTAPMFGGGIGTERVTEQYGVGRQPTAQEVQQTRVMAVSQQAREDEIAARAEAARLARVAAKEAAALRADERFDTLKSQADLRREIAQMTAGNRLPTTASLALEVANGDPQKALAILKNTDGRSPVQVQNFMRISGEWQKSPLSAAADRTAVLSASVKAVRDDPENATEQMLLGYAFIQAADTYQSAVREGELRNLGGLGTALSQLRQKVANIVETGAVMPPAVAKEVTDVSARLVGTLIDAANVKAQDFGRRATVAGIGDMWDEYYQPRPNPNAQKVVRDPKTGKLVPGGGS